MRVSHEEGCSSVKASRDETLSLLNHARCQLLQHALRINQTRREDEHDRGGVAEEGSSKAEEQGSCVVQTPAPARHGGVTRHV